MLMSSKIGSSKNLRGGLIKNQTQSKLTSKLCCSHQLLFIHEDNINISSIVMNKLAPCLSCAQVVLFSEDYYMIISITHTCVLPYTHIRTSEHARIA